MSHKNKGDHKKFKKFLIFTSHFIYFFIFNIKKYSFDLQIADANPDGVIFYLRLLSTKSSTFWKNCRTHTTIKETVDHG